MDSAAKNKSSSLLFLLLIVLSGFVAVVQAFDVEDDPHRSLGYGVQVPGNVKVPGRAITSFIPVNHLPPINVTRVLTTCHDGQTSVSIKVFEGDSSVNERERELSCAQYYEDGCDMKIASPEWELQCEDLDTMCHEIHFYYRYFGNVELHAISPAPRGLPRIEVTLALKDLRLHVTVTDKSTMKSNSTSFAYGIPRRINHYYRMQSPSEIAIWKVTELDPTLFPATRNYIHPDAVCLHDASIDATRCNTNGMSSIAAFLSVIS